MKILNVLYQSNDNYAAITGISMISLMENNKNIDEINFYLLDDNIASENIVKLEESVKKYGRKLIIIDTDLIIKRLKDELNVSPHRGTYTTYFKLVAVNLLQIPTDRVLQLDGDTIITGSLMPILDFDFEENIMAATYDCIANSYRKLIDIPLTDKYYNCGVILFNQPLWISECCEQKIIHHLKNVRNRYYIVDQDILNVLFRHKIKYLDITYNFNSGFYIYGVKNSFKLYGLSPEYYDTQEKVESVYPAPIIHHCMEAHGRPWEADNGHPQNELFDNYLRISPWHDYVKRKVGRPLIFKIQRKLYKLLPFVIYSEIHSKMLSLYLRKVNRDVQKN